MIVLFKDAFGLRKFSKMPDLSLKSLDDIKDHLYVNSEGRPPRTRSPPNQTVMFDESVERYRSYLMYQYSINQ